MKSIAIVLMIIASAYCQQKDDLLTPTKHEHYQDNVRVNLKAYGAENTRIRTDLDQQIKRKKELIALGNAHNAQLVKVTGYVGNWRKDIKKTHADTEAFKKSAELTRKQWTGVKKTQAYKRAPSVKVVAKKAKNTASKKALLRRLQAVEGQKTLESVNAMYRSQVNELEKNINHVIKQIKIVYANAEKDDKDAAALMVRENKTLADLKVFLKHLLEYIQWTRRTVKNYHVLFHTRPDNVFAKKTRRLIQKIKSVL